jgi:hypothetical protein
LQSQTESANIMPGKDFPSITQARRRYKHGTHARYVLARCRCEPCRASNRAYEQDRVARRKPLYELTFSPAKTLWVVRNVQSKRIAGRARTKAVAKRHADKLNVLRTNSSELIPTADVVRHVRWLQAQGIGIKTIAKNASVASSVLSRIVEGDIARTRRSTAAKILSIGASVVKNGARMRADDTLSLIANLVDAGYTRGWIAQELGASDPALQIGRSGWISIGKARQIHHLYLRIAAQDPKVPHISTTFKIGEAESSMVRHRGQNASTVTAAKTLVQSPHGTAARAQRGCRCKACTRASSIAIAAKSRFGRLRYMARALGTQWAVMDTVAGSIAFRSKDKAAAFNVAGDLNAKDPRASLSMLVDATPVRNYLRDLYSRGTTIAAIARASGISAAQVHFLMRGRSQRTSARYASTLLGLSPSAMPTQARVDAGPTHVLVDRLEAVGFDLQWLAVVLDLPVSTFRVRTKRVPVERARDIAALYCALRDRVPTLAQLERETI